MKTYFLPAFRLTAITIILFAVIYPLAILCIAQLLPGKGMGVTVFHNDRKHYINIGQHFYGDQYFQSRPSAVNYNAAGSGGSNKASFNAAYLKDVQAKIDTFLIHNPTVKKADIPVDIVTASGSGLDPHISIKAARVQIARVALMRGIKEEVLSQLLSQCIEEPLIGLFGTYSINVLKLNMALDKLQATIYH